SGGDGDGHRKSQHAPSHSDVVEARETLRDESQQDTLGAEEDDETRDAAEQEQQKNLDQQRSHEARPLRSQSQANRHLTTARAGPGEQQIGDVDATDQEDQSDRAEQEYERLVHAGDDAFA